MATLCLWFTCVEVQFDFDFRRKNRILDWLVPTELCVACALSAGMPSGRFRCLLKPRWRRALGSMVFVIVAPSLVLASKSGAWAASVNPWVLLRRPFMTAIPSGAVCTRLCLGGGSLCPQGEAVDSGVRHREGVLWIIQFD